MRVVCSNVLHLTRVPVLVDGPPKYRRESLPIEGVEQMARRMKRFLGLAVAIAFVSVLFVSSLSHASATVVTIAQDSAVGKNSLAMPGSQDILKDSLGKYLAVYVNSTGRLSVVFANRDPIQTGAWGTPASSAATPVAFSRPAAVITSPFSMRIIAEGGTAAGTLVDVPVSLNRDLVGNIASVSFGSPTVLATSAQYPSATLAHDGSIILVWNSAVTGVSSKVLSLRWTFITGWTSVSDPFSRVPDTVVVDTMDTTGIQANVIERPDNFAVYVIGNRAERSNQTNLVFNSATFGGVGWTWGTQNLVYETNASRGLSDSTDLAWDPVRSVVVVTYDISRTSRYGVIQIDASGGKVHIDTPDLKLTNNEWGVLMVDSKSGDYVLFTMDTPLGPHWGQEYGNVTYTRRVNGIWSATLTAIDSGGDNMAISPRRPALADDGSFEFAYAKGKTAPGVINFVRLNL
jgi:hypothetical protein